MPSPSPSPPCSPESGQHPDQLARLTRIAAWDVGFKDLVVCFATLVSGAGTLHPVLQDVSWHHMDLGSTAYSRCIGKLVTEFRNAEDQLRQCSVCLIESQQGSRGHGLVVLSHVIQALMLRLRPDARVQFIPSYRKFDVFKPRFGDYPHDVQGVASKSGQYARRKKNSVWMTQQLLHAEEAAAAAATPENQNTLQRFNAAAAHLQADIADAFGILAVWAATQGSQARKAISRRAPRPVGVGAKRARKAKAAAQAQAVVF